MLSFNNDNYHDLLSVRKFEDNKGIVKSRIRTDNTMANGKRTKGQKRIYKTLHRKLKIEQHETH
jgi:hypothetical protein